MLTLTPEQFALLSLPDPYEFAPALAAEVRRDFSTSVAGMDDAALVREVEQSYVHASEYLRITHLPILVGWVKVDVASMRELRRDMTIDLRIRQSDWPHRTARDLLCAMHAVAAWPKEND